MQFGEIGGPGCVIDRAAPARATISIVAKAAAAGGDIPDKRAAIGGQNSATVEYRAACTILAGTVIHGRIRARGVAIRNREVEER